jgi:hypothetical protein
MDVLSMDLAFQDHARRKAHMYHIHYTGNGDSWCIIDESLTVAFVGTKDQTEDWLDLQENVRRRPSVASFRPLIDGSIHRIVRFFTAIRGWLRSRSVAHL